ncbi:MAG: TIGR02301 family protein [Alphaproteobacteria bacterium]|nr:TIGR02301 family protein [Alphaproteobacteria bacterium]
MTPTTSLRRTALTPPKPSARAVRQVCLAVLLAAPAAVLPAPPALAQATKAYDSQLLRLSEILGAVHYLRELCGAGEGQLWREQMRSIIRAEGSSALRRARLSRSFNEGYRSYSRTYKICTASAKTAVERFLTEGTGIAEELIKENP